MARPLAIALLALLALVLRPPSAGAHALPVRVEPADGATLEHGPQELHVWFGEEISTRFRIATLLDGRGHVVPGAQVVAGNDPRELVLRLPALRRGTYAVTWEVLAQDDGHVTGGTQVFGVGVRPAGSARRGGAVPGDLGSPAEGGLRWLDLSLLALLVGGLAMSALLAGVTGDGGRGEPAGRARLRARRALGEPARRATLRVLALASWSGALAVALGVLLLARQADALRPTLGPDASLPDAVGRLLTARWGVWWIAREALLAALVVVALLLGRRARAGRALPLAAFAAAGALALALAAVRAASGHAAAAGAAHVVADAGHVLAAALWIGGVAAFAVAVWPGRRARGADETVALARACRPPLAWMAGSSVVVLAASGLLAAGAEVTSVDALLTTAYGQTLLVKMGLALAAAALGLGNFLLLRRLARGGLLRGRLLVAESAVGVEVLVAAAILTASLPARGPEFAPPRAPRPPTLARQVGDVLVSATPRPNRPGQNVVTVLAVSSRRPAPGPIEGVALRVTPAGAGGGRRAERVPLAALAPGRFAGGVALDAAGRWRMSVVVRRGGRRLRADFAWAVARPDPARPVVVSARPLAPLLDRAAALVGLGAAAVVLGAVAVRRLRRRARAAIDGLEEEAIRP